MSKSRIYHMRHIINASRRTQQSWPLMRGVMWQGMKNMPPPSMGIDDHLQAYLAELHPIVSRYSYPLFAADNQDRPDLFASCVFIDINNIPYLVTAAHALYEIEKTGSKVHVGAAAIKEITTGDIRSSKDG